MGQNAGFSNSDSRAYLGDEPACRRFVEGVIWISRTGAQWHLLPAEYGNWNSVYKRFGRWCDHGVWELMLVHFADDLDMEDTWRYRERHLIERFIGKIKHFRRIFSRFDKLARCYPGFLQLTGTLIWLR